MRLFFLPLAALVASGCASSTIEGTTGAPSSTGRRPAATSGAASATGTGTTASSGTSGGSTTSSGSTGTTGGVDCGQPFLDAWYDGGENETDCASGLAEVKGRLTSVCDALAPITASFSPTDALDPSIVGTGAACGVYYYCVAPGTHVTPLFEIPGYATTAVATVDTTQPVAIAHTGLALFCDAVIDSLPAETLSPPFDPSLTMVYVHVSVLGTQDACGHANGWSFAAYDLDGGSLDAGAMFITGAGAIQTDAGTDGNAVEVLYNLPAALGSVTVAPLGIPPLPDGGPGCPNLATSAPFEFTGVVPLLSTGDGMTFFPFAVQ